MAPILPPLLQTLQVLLTAPRAVQTSPQVQVSVEVDSVTGSPPASNLEDEIEDAIEEAVAANNSRRKRKGGNQGVYPERENGSRRKEGGRVGKNRTEKAKRRTGQHEGGITSRGRDGRIRAKDLAMAEMERSFRRNDETGENFRASGQRVDAGTEENFRRMAADMGQNRRIRNQGMVGTFGKNNGNMDGGMEGNFKRNNEEMELNQGSRKGRMGAGMGENYRRTDVGIERIDPRTGGTFTRRTAAGTEMAEGITRKLKRIIAEEERAIGAIANRNRNARANEPPKQIKVNEGGVMGKKLLMAAAKAVLKAEDEAKEIEVERLENQTLETRCKVLHMLGIIWLAPFCHQDVLNRS